MASRVAFVLAVFVACIAVTVAVVPKARMYVSFPLTATTTTTAASASPPANTTSSNTTTTTTTTQLNFIPLGQVLGNIFAAVFGTPTAGAVNIMPIGAAFGYLLQSFFGSGWTPSG